MFSIQWHRVSSTTITWAIVGGGDSFSLLWRPRHTRLVRLICHCIRHHTNFVVSWHSVTRWCMTAANCPNSSRVYFDFCCHKVADYKQTTVDVELKLIPLNNSFLFHFGIWIHIIIQQTSEQLSGHLKQGRTHFGFVLTSYSNKLDMQWSSKWINGMCCMYDSWLLFHFIPIRGRVCTAV